MNPLTSDGLAEVICGLVEQIAKREKEKSLDADNYAEALVLAMLEGIFKEVRLNIK